MGTSWLVVSGVVVCVAAVALEVIALLWRRSLMAAAGALIAVCVLAGGVVVVGLAGDLEG